MSEEMDGLISFYASHHAIRAEKVLVEAGFLVALIPGPRELSPNCGVALPFASNAPMPGSLVAIFLINVSKAAPFPYFSSMPSVSAVVRMPFSKQSMAQAMVAPQEMVSMPYMLQSWLAWQMSPRSVFPQ